MGRRSERTSPWAAHPVIYEINTWVWLHELGRKHGSPITLAGVPGAEWEAIAELAVDAVWFMGVWERSPASVAIANANPCLLEEFRAALPDFGPEDNIGSAYSVKNYAVDGRLGGSEGLAVARQELAKRGVRLILDFVPNHVALDHPWAARHPEYFVQGTPDDVEDEPESFVQASGKVFACGRDPFFPAWTDVLQLNAFDPGLRGEAAETLSGIADQCDGVRCDMAMLLINSVFERTWGERAGARPGEEYWVEVITAAKKRHPDFLFLAEAYWDLERELLHLGFDYCYDKRLLDLLEHDLAVLVRRHLRADPTYQSKLVRFIENHDEPRALSAFSPRKLRAAAVVMATVPGAKLFHEGQFEGRKVRLPVHLARRPKEPVDPDLQAFYRTLLGIASLEGLRDGRWRLCKRTGWPDNASHRSIVAWVWHGAEERLLVVVNLSPSDAQGLVPLPWPELEGGTWRMTDLLTGQTYERKGDGMLRPGLHVELPPWGIHVLGRWRPAERPEGPP
jgi:glycosidase